MRCGNAPANTCVKKCSETVPPCIMDVGADSFEIKVKSVNGVPPCGDVVPYARQMHNAAIAKGDVLTDIHKSSVTFDEAVGFAHAAKDALKADLDDPDFPEDYRKKAAEEINKADLVIKYAEKEIPKLAEVEEKVKATESYKEIPKELRLKVKELKLASAAHDQDAWEAGRDSKGLHSQAFGAVAKVATEKAEQAAAKARAAAEAAAAAKKAAEEAKAAKAKAAKEAAEKAAAKKREAEKAAAEAAKKAIEAKKKALVEFCDPAAKPIKPTKAGVVPINVTVRNQCFAGTGGTNVGVYTWLRKQDLGQWKDFNGEGVFTVNLYKGGVLCSSWTLDYHNTPNRWAQVHKFCTTAKWKCKFTTIEREKNYCWFGELPWTSECGECNKDLVQSNYAGPRHNANTWAAPGDIMEIFPTADGPCKPGWRDDACPASVSNWRDVKNKGAENLRRWRAR